MRLLFKLLLGFTTMMAMAQANADINVGVIVSLTGPAASAGIPERDSIVLWSKRIAGHKVNLTILDDASDPSKTTAAARKLVTEKNVDVLIGASVTPTTLAALQVAAETRTPLISIAGGGAIVNPQDDIRKWAFKMPPPEEIPLGMIYDTMKKQGKKSLAIVAMSNAYGQTFVDVAQKTAGQAGIDLVREERFSAADTSFVSQAMKLIHAKPDAILIVAAGSPAVMPQLELKSRGYDGLIFQTQAVAGNDFLRLGGKALNGTYMPVSPFLVAEQLPDGNPTKVTGKRYVDLYEAKYGPGSRSLFGGCAWDTLLLLEDAAKRVPKTAQPGTPAFRAALRDALEHTNELVLTQGVYNMTPADHNGADARSQVMVRIEDGKWRYVAQ